jgi:DNA-binding transcriptional LysR family regulator
MYREIILTSTLINKRSGLLRLGASTDNFHIYSALLAKFHLKLQDVKVSLLNGEQIRAPLVQQEIEMLL